MRALLCDVLAAVGLAGATPAWLGGPPPGQPVAVVEHAGRVLVGTDRGLYREDAAGWELVLTRGGVRDLATGPSATLIATAGGLYVWPLDRAEPEPVRIGAGARVRSVAIDAEGVEWVGTEVGLFARRPGERGFEREPGLAAGEVVAVRTAGQTLYAASRGALRVRHAGSPFELALRSLDDGWWELLDAVELPAGTALVVPRGLWLLDESGAGRALELPIGELAAAVRAEDALWLAAARGLYRLPLARVEERELEPGLDARASDVALADGRLLVATARGVAELRARAPVARPAARPAARSTGFVSAEHSPAEVRELHRAVLRYLELGAGRMSVLEARSARAPLLPQLSAAFSTFSDRARSRDRDQTFTSGDLRNLFDHSFEHGSSAEFEVELVWHLQDLAGPERAIAISRERRELVELRDQVLDRVNRLYFERQRVLARITALGPERASERAELELRASELAAGLDAWSGGAFSRLTATRPDTKGDLP